MNLIEHRGYPSRGQAPKIYATRVKTDSENGLGYYFLTKVHGDAHGNNFFYNNDDKELSHNESKISEDSFYRISMIDFASIIRTSGGIGDPAEDVGRFLGSLWDWAARPSDQKYEDYKKLRALQNKFIESYLREINTYNIISKENQKKFERIFNENHNFYKFRFYKAIFNSKNDKNIKLNILKSWLEENRQSGIPSSASSLDSRNEEISENPTNESTDNSKVIYWLPERPAGFIESTQQGTNKSYLSLLKEKLQGKNTRITTLSSTIAGMGGIGKTSLALEYAHEALKNKAYNLIYWLLSETDSSLLKGYRELLERIGVVVKNDDAKYIMKMLKEKIPTYNKCLFIYDNVPDPDFLTDKVPTENNLDILITSRCNKGWENPIDLSVFRPEDSAKYLLHTIGLEDNETNNEKAKKLADELGHLPLALSHAAHYIKLVGGKAVSKEIIEEYIKNFKENPTGHFEKNENPFKSDQLEMNHENLIKKTYKISTDM